MRKISGRAFGWMEAACCNTLHSFCSHANAGLLKDVAGLRLRSAYPIRSNGIAGYRFTVRCAKRSRAASGQGFGTKAPPRTASDAGILLRRSEQLYDQLLEKYNEERKIREFVICVRQKSAGQSKRLEDWLPVAELALVSEQDAEEVVPQALHRLCREVAECAAKRTASLRQIPRSNLEYAYEPASDFYELVLGSCFKSAQQQQQDRTATDDCPYAILGLTRTASASQVRMAYRTLAAKYHPDTNPGMTDDEKFKEVVSAYERIKQTGFTASPDYGYAAIGGNGRQGFSMPITIDSLNISKEPLEGMQVAVRQIDPEIVSLFSARSCSAS